MTEFYQAPVPQQPQNPIVRSVAGFVARRWPQTYERVRNFFHEEERTIHDIHPSFFLN